MHQDPQMLLSCIDFRYITDVLTEKDAYGELCVSLGASQQVHIADAESIV